ICWLSDWIFPCSLRYSGAAHCIRGIREKPDENGDDFFRLAAWKVDFTQGRLLPTLMPVMSSVDRETRQLQLLLVMGVDDSLGGV
ncbi:hypothetical protein ACSLNA_25825, partial [Escherichia coli]|uniref:hypothetical protein n=1 Tax=Escherichia coli TaxID=562 RepID=UPI003EE35E49